MLTSIFTNFTLISSYLGELLAAGPDAITLVKDVVRAVNDFRAGKLTADEFTTIFEDAKKLAIDLFAPKPLAPAA